MEIMLMRHDEFDVLLCDVPIKNAALSFSLVGHPGPRA